MAGEEKLLTVTAHNFSPSSADSVNKFSQCNNRVCGLFPSATRQWIQCCFVHRTPLYTLMYPLLSLFIPFLPIYKSFLFLSSFFVFHFPSPSSRLSVTFILLPFLLLMCVACMNMQVCLDSILFVCRDCRRIYKICVDCLIRLNIDLC